MDGFWAGFLWGAVACAGFISFLVWFCGEVALWFVEQDRTEEQRNQFK